MISVKYLSALLIFLLATYPAISQDSSEFTIHHYTSKNGLPQNSIRSMLMDNDRFLWMTTEGGLVRFDGQFFMVYNHSNTPEIQNDRFLSVIKTIDGNFVAYDQARSTFKIENGKPLLVYAGNRKTPPKMSVEGSVPNIEFLTNSFSMNIKGIEPKDLFDGTLRVFPLNKNDYGYLLNHKLVIYYKDQLSKEIATNPYTIVKCFVISGIIYFYDQKGNLFYFDLRANSIKPAHIKEESNTSGITNYIVWKNVIWNYAYQDVYLKINTTLYQLNVNENPSELSLKLITSNLPPNCKITDAFYDKKSNNLFIGTDSKGLYIYKSKYFKTLVYSNPFGTADNSYYNQCEIDSGRILTWRNKEFTIEGGKNTTLPINNISHEFLFKDSDNNIWYTRLDSLYAYNLKQNKLSAIYHLKNQAFFCMIQEGDSFFVATSEGICQIKNSIFSVYFNVNSSDPDSKIEDIIRGPDGNLWIASCTGVAILNTTNGTYKHVPGLQNICARTLFKEGSKVFVGTYGDGFFVWEDGKVYSPLLDRNKYLSHVHSFLVDKNNYMWMSTNKGLLRTRYENLLKFINDPKTKFNYQVFGEDDGILNSEFNGGCSPSVLRLSTSYVSYPTMEGMVWFKPEEIPDEYPDEKIVLDNVQIDGVNVSPKTNISLPNNHESVKIFFSTPYWSNAINLNLEYFLDGFNKDWIPVPPGENAVLFSNLPSGHYIFKIRELNGIDKDSYTETKLMFTVEKKFYETTAFLLFFIIGTSGLILLLLKFNSKRILKKNLDLEKSIEERTQELRQANKQLEVNFSELAEKEQFLRDTILVKDRLISVISHDIITPLKFISMVSRISKKNPDLLNRKKLIDSMNDIEFASDKLYNNASNILNWMKFQNNRITPKMDYIAFHDFVDELLEPLLGMADIRGLKIENKIPEEDIIITDRNILTIVLQNILSNAIKYSDKGIITFSAFQNEQTYLVSVEDNGIGMSPDKLSRIEKIKSRQVHLSNSNFNPDTSSNLGYYIIVDFLHLLGGSIDVQSELGKGSKITIKLPIKD